MFLTKHEGQTFTNQTIYVSGNAFINCTFSACTLVLREPVYHLEGCVYDRCNWHIDRVLMWGNMDGIRELKSLVLMMESGLEQHQKATEQAAGQNQPGQMTSNGGASQG
jgi:hypothetical protein